MAESRKLLIFLCPGAFKTATQKLSYRIASTLQTLGIADIATLQQLSEQRSLAPELQKRMIFINDCRSGCVNILTHGFEKDNFLYLDVSPYIASPEFDIQHYLQREVFPKLKAQWNYSFFSGKPSAGHTGK